MKVIPPAFRPNLWLAEVQYKEIPERVAAVGVVVTGAMEITPCPPPKSEVVEPPEKNCIPLSVVKKELVLPLLMTTYPSAEVPVPEERISWPPVELVPLIF